MSTAKTDPCKPPAVEAVLSVDDAILELLPLAVYACDAAGRITRFNRRAVEVWGRTPRLDDDEERFCGAWRTYRGDGTSLPREETPMARALRTGEAMRDTEVWIERPDGSRACIAVDINPVRDGTGAIAGAVNCFQDITARKVAEERLRAAQHLLRESERRVHDILQALPMPLYTTDREGRITFYNDAAAELWGHRPKIGEARWCGSWRLYRPDGAAMRHDECPMAIALKERRPVRDTEAIAERPDGTRVTFAPYPTLLYDSDGELSGAVNILVDISRHKQAEARQELLINELNHRVKNTLASVQSIASQTLRSAISLDGARHDFESRLLALSQAHDLLTRGLWQRAGLRALLTQEFAPYRAGPDKRVRLIGEDVALSPRAILSLAMVLHELATNAAKYGALSTADGSIEIAWRVDEDAVDHVSTLRLSWTEAGGPPVAPPARRGFGSRLLERGVRHELHGEARTEFLRDGLRCRIVFPLVDEPSPI